MVLGVVVYALVAWAYFLLVLSPLRGWVKRVADDHQTLYAVLALAWIVLQSVLLERLTSVLLEAGRREED